MVGRFSAWIISESGHEATAYRWLTSIPIRRGWEAAVGRIEVLVHTLCQVYHADQCKRGTERMGREWFSGGSCYEQEQSVSSERFSGHAYR
jgi:hypothetical protein